MCGEDVWRGGGGKGLWVKDHNLAAAASGKVMVPPNCCPFSTAQARPLTLPTSWRRTCSYCSSWRIPPPSSASLRRRAAATMRRCTSGCRLCRRPHGQCSGGEGEQGDGQTVGGGVNRQWRSSGASTGIMHLVIPVASRPPSLQGHEECLHPPPAIPPTAGI